MPQRNWSSTLSLKAWTVWKFLYPVQTVKNMTFKYILLFSVIGKIHGLKLDEDRAMNFTGDRKVNRKFFSL